MRIAYVTETYPPEINGVSLTADRCLRHLRAAGHQVQLLRPRQPGEEATDGADEWRTPGGPIPMYPELRYGVAGVARLRRRWRRDGPAAPDLVHVTTPGPLSWAALRAARAEGLPTSADFRTNFHTYCHHYRLGWMEPLVVGYLRRLHAMADQTFVPTPELATALRERGFERLQVVGRGVDTQRFAPSRRCEALRQRWQAGPDDPVLLHVGRLAPEKNVELALQTAERLRAIRPNLRMVVVGNGPQRARLQAAYPHVHFVGVQRDIELARHYASADLFLFPSLTDTFGNVTLEAMASGLAVVAFDTAAAALHLHHGHSGWLAAPLPGSAGRELFFDAARHALAQWQPDSPLRQLAVQAATLADWDAVLRGFEQRLRVLAARPSTVSPHAALA